MAIYQKAYLGSTPLFREKLWYESSGGIILDTIAGVTVTANSSANTKGAWTELIASTSANGSYLFFRVSVIGSTGVNTATLIDFATGASGSESVIAQNIAVGSAFNPLHFGIPFKVPTGTRISARIQSVVTGGKTASVECILINAGDYDNSPTTVDIIGGNTVNSQGISFSGSSGTWTQAIASTSRAYKAVCLVLSSHSSDTAQITQQLYSVGIGLSGNEIEIGNVRHNYGNGETSQSQTPFLFLFGYDIPLGSRLAVKHPITTNPNRYGFTLICIP